MAVEKKWLAVTATPLIANGTTLGLITVANTAGFKVKGSAWLATTGPSPITLQVQIQRVLSHTQMIVGTIGSTPAPNNFVDVSMFTVAAGSVIAFPEQDKNKIKPDDIDQAVYEADPVIAKRVILVDTDGEFFDETNPLPVSGGGSGFTPSRFGDVKVTYDSNSNATRYSFYSKTVLQGYIIITYDSNGNQTDYQSYDASGNPL